MAVSVRALVPSDIPHVVAFSLRAWAPVFRSMETVLGPGVYRRLYPHWESSQATAVETNCTNPAARTWVATADEAGRPIGFAVVYLHDEQATLSGEIDMIAVDPQRQRRGVARALIEVATAHMREQGAGLAVIATGGDPGHAPARRTYESAGFTALPLVRYYRRL